MFLKLICLIWYPPQSWGLDGLLFCIRKVRDDVMLYCSYGVKHQIRFGAFIFFLLRALEYSILFFSMCQLWNSVKDGLYNQIEIVLVFSLFFTLFFSWRYVFFLCSFHNMTSLILIPLNFRKVFFGFDLHRFCLEWHVVSMSLITMIWTKSIIIY